MLVKPEDNIEIYRPNCKLPSQCAARTVHFCFKKVENKNEAIDLWNNEYIACITRCRHEWLYGLCKENECTFGKGLIKGHDETQGE